MHTKVVITCPTHGDFKQTPGNHLSKRSGCPKCATDYRIQKNTKSVELFLHNAQVRFHNKYDYSKIKYVNTKTKIEIVCPEHGSFFQSPEKHITSKIGCPACASKHTAKLLSMSFEEFEKKSSVVHNNKYDYSISKDNFGDHDKIDIQCNQHGIFNQTITNHLHGNGCPLCAKENQFLTQAEFISKSTQIHGNVYDYRHVNYVNTKTPVIILCSHHGRFNQIPQIHLQGSGCQLCSRSGFSKKAIGWLDSVSNIEHIFIQHAGNGGEFVLPGSKKRVDGYCKETNTVYEFHGDCWHGNPKKFKDTDHCHPLNKRITAGELYTRTVDKDLLIQQLGFNLIIMWESDYNE